MACGIFSCSTWALLVGACGSEPGPPALGAQSLNHWTTREVPGTFLDCFFLIATATPKGKLKLQIYCKAVYVLYISVLHT